MKVCVIADTHIHPFTSFGVGTGASNSRVQVSLDTLKQVHTFCLLKGIKHLVHAGDLFHARDHQRYGIFNAVSEQLQVMARDLQIHLIAGNHDIVDKQGTLSISTLGNIPNVEVCSPRESPGCLNMEFRVTPIPYTTDYEGLNQIMQDWRPDLHIIGHLDIQGAAMGSALCPSPKGLDRKVLAKFKSVLLGHYHQRQSFLPNGHYVGALTPVDFGDLNQAGSFCILETDTGEITWHEVQCPKFVEFNMIEFVSSQAKLSERIAGNYVRFRCKAGDFDTVQDWLKQQPVKGSEWLPVLQEEEHQTRIDDVGELSWSDLASRYVDMKEPKLDKERLMKIGEEALSCVQF